MYKNESPDQDSTSKMFIHFKYTPPMPSSHSIKLTVKWELLVLIIITRAYEGRNKNLYT